MKRIIYCFIIMLLIGLIAISSFFIYKNYREDKEQQEIFENLIDIAETKISDTNENDKINFEELYKINNDIVGWLKIDGTNINYPVMQTKNSPNYYLRRNFYKEYSTMGTPYLSEKCDIQSSDNLIIYGHHIKSNKMFAELEQYENESFYKEHKLIKFYTREENAEYEVITVFKTKVDEGFKFYNYYNFKNISEFYTFIDKCKELALFSTVNSAEYGEQLITLTTCEYSQKNGRLVIVAKKINTKIQDIKEEKETTTTVSSNIASNKVEKNEKEEKPQEKIQNEKVEATTETNSKITSNYDENTLKNGHLIGYPSFGSNYATLKISNIGVNAPIFFGTTDELLLKGVTHDTGSYFCGENGSIIMCGHNYMNSFKRLRRIKNRRYY